MHQTLNHIKVYFRCCIVSVLDLNGSYDLCLTRRSHPHGTLFHGLGDLSVASCLWQAHLSQRVMSLYHQLRPYLHHGCISLLAVTRCYALALHKEHAFLECHLLHRHASSFLHALL